MENIAGSPVEGDNFFGRETAVAQQKEALLNHDILLLGPRRIGKTSVARKVMAEMGSEKQWRAIEINVAASTDERGFLEKLEAKLREHLDTATGKIWESLKSPFSAFSDRIKAVKIPIPGAGSIGIDLHDSHSEDWTKVGNEVITLIAQLESPWLIYVDELPIMLFNIIRSDQANGVQRVRRFLDWFRNDVRNLPASGRVRWLVSGSVGLDTLVQQHGMADTINSMKHLGLQPFTDDEAKALLHKLVERYELTFSGADIAALIAAIQWLQPYYIQLAFSELRSQISANPGKTPVELIDAAINQMAQPGSDNDFHFWEQRLFLQLPNDQARQAIAMLTQAAATREGVRPETLLASLQESMGNVTDEEARTRFINLRDILQRDAYWTPEERDGIRRYRFVLEPLRRWWIRRNTL